MSEHDYYVYGGAYSDLADAQADFDTIKSFYDQGFLRGYEAAIFTKNAEGGVDIINTETPHRAHGAAWGAATGTLVGMVFPVLFLTGAPVAAGTAGGALIANWTKSFGRDDVRKMGEMLDQGQSGVMIVADVVGDLPVDRLLSRTTESSVQSIPDAKAVHDYLQTPDAK